VLSAPALLLTAALTGGPDVAALGVVVSARPERSTAILRAEGRTRVVSVGDTAFGGRVVAVTPRQVVLEFPHGRVEARLAAEPPAARAPAPAAPAAADAASEDPATPHRRMERREVERRLAEEIPRILGESALAPVIEEGRVKGVALTRLAQGTLLTDAGLQAGDVLTRINDIAIDGLATLVGLWPRLQNETELRAVVLRQGRPVSLVVTLR